MVWQEIHTKLFVLSIVLTLLLFPATARSYDGDLLWAEGQEVENPGVFVSDKNGGVITVWEIGGEIRAQRYDADDGDGLPDLVVETHRLYSLKNRCSN